ncbi:MAG: carboxypeptidase regulatory-like domain-containing protein [Rhizobiales bacterium]|nr:carboxypeptidase regulatory-like domain-containing protein [Hyphomicrobiales bacterium]
MRMTRALYSGVAAFALAIAMSGPPAQLHAQTSTPAVAIDNDDIGGVVTGPKGPEAGVWVIAETRDLPTRYAKMVVTDDQGRYVVPDLPKAKYKVWVRGYGLVDSDKFDAQPGQQLNLRAVAAPNDAAAAQYYPAAYWYAMMKIPGEDQFGGKSDIPARIKQTDWLNNMKNNGCVGCHQLGQLSTRTLPPKSELFSYATHEEAWVRRIQAGQSGVLMVRIVGDLLGGAPIKYFADWTQRIEKGELPKHKPNRPQGVERNVVVTTWDMGEADRYLHDLIASDRRNPTVNAYGPILGSPEYSGNNLPILDPKTHKVTFFKAPVRDPDTPEGLGPGHAAMDRILGPSPYWGEQKIWDTKVNNHNAMVDKHGRFWLAAVVRGPKNPAFCQKGSDHPSAKLTPMAQTHRGVTMLDPKTMKYTFVDTCFQTHHLQFAYDANETLWTSSGGGGGVVGWINTKMFDETGDAAKAQGWTALILDTNGDGKRGEYTEAKEPFDSSKDRRVPRVFYAVMPSPVDGSVWGTLRGSPGSIVRLAPGSNPPETALAEIYHVPMPGFGVRGGDIDSKGVVWVSLASGHIGSFDRSKCKAPLNGPKATGNHCPEGWSFHQYPGPGFDGLGDNSVESSYYSWVDQHDTFGLGRDIPMSTANLMNGIAALNLKDGKMVSLQVPYPMGFYAKGFDGRIDDPNAGWKGRGLWASSGDRAPWLQEGGKGMKPMAVQFQLRPDPLAK